LKSCFTPSIHTKVGSHARSTHIIQNVPSLSILVASQQKQKKKEAYRHRWDKAASQQLAKTQTNVLVKELPVPRK
jgi:hypothetical protein